MAERAARAGTPPPTAESLRMAEVAQRMWVTLGTPVVVAACETGDQLVTLAVAPEDQLAPRVVDLKQNPRMAQALDAAQPVVLDVDASAAYGASQVLMIPWNDGKGDVGACFVIGVGADAHPAKRMKYISEAAPERIRAIREEVRRERRIVELEQSASAFRALAESTSDAVKVLDLDGRVRVWNPACEKLYGYSAHEVIGQVLPHVPPADRSRWIADMRGTAASGTVMERDVPAVRKDGSLFRASVCGIPLHDAEGLPVGMLTVVRSVDADTRLEQMEDDFLSLVTQELKNPLTAILGFSQLLTRPEMLDDPRKRARIAKALETRAREMSAVVDDLLTASRVEKSGLVLRREPTDVAALVTETVSVFERSQQRHRFTVDADTRMPPADADGRRIAQALTNILENAVRHSPFAEDVRVTVVRDGDFASVSVTDRGEGIPAADLERVFDRFYKTKDSKGDPGPGLGLYLVRTIVEAHGGTVSVVSKAKHGSTFTIRLPLAVS